MHRSHEYLAKIAIEVCDGVLVHALLGGLKPGESKQIRGKIYLIRGDGDDLLKRYLRDFPEHGNR